MVLEQDFIEKIEAFKESCTNFNVFITPMFHNLFYHVEEFIEAKGEPLGAYSEQSSKPLDFNFGIHWSHR